VLPLQPPTAETTPQLPAKTFYGLKTTINKGRKAYSREFGDTNRSRINFMRFYIPVKTLSSRAFISDTIYTVDKFSFPEVGVGLLPKRACLLALAYYAIPR
jgi:hypothetical protein